MRGPIACLFLSGRSQHAAHRRGPARLTRLPPPALLTPAGPEAAVGSGPFWARPDTFASSIRAPASFRPPGICWLLLPIQGDLSMLRPARPTSGHCRPVRPTPHALLVPAAADTPTDRCLLRTLAPWDSASAEISRNCHSSLGYGLGIR